MITKEQLISAIKKRPLIIHRCSICEYPCSFSYRGDMLGYDSGCDCTYQRGGWEPRDEAALDFYLDPEHGWEKELGSFWGATEGL